MGNTSIVTGGSIALLGAILWVATGRDEINDELASFESGEFSLGDWLDERSAKIEIQQNMRPGSWHRGTLLIDGVSFDLGETPPLYRHQLATTGTPVLLGEKSDRHFVTRYVRPVVPADSGISIEGGVSITVPRRSPMVGIAVKAQQFPVREIALIVPKLEPPAGIPDGFTPWRISIRTNGGSYMSGSVFDELPLEEIDSSLVVLIPYGEIEERGQQDFVEGRSKVHLLWFEVDRDGRMTRVGD